MALYLALWPKNIRGEEGARKTARILGRAAGLCPSLHESLQSDQTVGGELPHCNVTMFTNIHYSELQNARRMLIDLGKDVRSIDEALSLVEDGARPLFAPSVKEGSCFARGILADLDELHQNPSPKRKRKNSSRHLMPPPAVRTKVAEQPNSPSHHTLSTSNSQQHPDYPATSIGARQAGGYREAYNNR